MRELHEKATELRDQHLLNLLNLARELQDKERAKMIETIRNQERRHRGYGLLKYFRGKAVRSQAVDEIKIPSSWTTRDKDDTTPLEDPKKLYARTPNRKDISNDPNWITITTPSEILEYCRMRNQQHFGQAYTEGNPFTKEPLSTQLSWNGQSREAQMVLQGDYTVQDQNNIQQLFLKHLVRVTPTDTFNATVSLKDYEKMARINFHLTIRLPSWTL